MAARYGIAAAVVRPCDVELGVNTLKGSAVAPATVAGFPHGTQTTAVKLYEIRDLLRRGAKEIELVIGVPKLLSREFQHVQTELMQASETCRKEGAILKVTLETSWLTDELKIIACRCCERADVHFVKTSTGYAPGGYTIEDVKLMRQHLPEEIGIVAAGGICTADQALELYELGCTRFATTATPALLDEWKARVAPPATKAQPLAAAPGQKSGDTPAAR
jgi:deoxyribose-phosphate aldolase